MPELARPGHPRLAYTRLEGEDIGELLARACGSEVYRVGFTSFRRWSSR